MVLDVELLNKVMWKIANTLALVGSRSGDERNAMTASWITQLSMEPVLIGVAVDNEAITHRLITQGGSFTVNLWDASDARVFVKFSKPAVDDGATLNGRAVRAATTGAPVFDEALAWMDCAVRHRLDLGTHTLFVGEVVDAAERRRGPSRLHERHPHEVRRRQAPLTTVGRHPLVPGSRSASSPSTASSTSIRSSRSSRLQPTPLSRPRGWALAPSSRSPLA